MGHVCCVQLGRDAKKLIDAARHWAGVAADDLTLDRGIVDALAAFGAREADIEAARARQTPDVFQVYPENWDCVQVFLAMQTQWRTAAFSGFGAARLMYIGLDYCAVEPVCRLLDVKKKRRAAIFQSLRSMENAVLDALDSN